MFIEPFHYRIQLITNPYKHYCQYALYRSRVRYSTISTILLISITGNSVESNTLQRRNRSTKGYGARSPPSLFTCVNIHNYYLNYSFWKAPKNHLLFEVIFAKGWGSITSLQTLAKKVGEQKNLFDCKVCKSWREWGRGVKVCGHVCFFTPLLNHRKIIIIDQNYQFLNTKGLLLTKNPS